MANHRVKWAQNGIDMIQVLMVLTLCDATSMPVWSPVRLCDWVALVRSEPLVVRRVETEVSHAVMRGYYKYASQGSCECTLFSQSA